MTSLIKTTKFLISVPLLFALSSCQAAGDMMGIGITGYNHTDKDIGFFSVNGHGQSFIGRHGQSGDSCCISISSRYEPGMTVKVRWGGEDIGKTQERVVTVPPYEPEEAGVFAVHFLRDGEVKVFVTVYILQHPKYPLKGEEAKL